MPWPAVWVLEKTAVFNTVFALFTGNEMVASSRWFRHRLFFRERRMYG